jgi:hypothetical protein
MHTMVKQLNTIARIKKMISSAEPEKPRQQRKIENEHLFAKETG